MSDVGLDEHVGRVLGQRYRLVSPVGTGASARVYLAEDTTLRRRVAVKLLHQALASDPKFRKRFRAEAHSSAQLSHPNIMAVYDWNEPGEGPASAPAYLVTELLTGGSLRAMLDAGNQLSLSQALIVGLHASEGLSYAHHNGFVHRDIKPANLLFGSEGRLRIADFGIARAVAEAAWTEPEGSLVGTARYAAPEQAAGATIDGRADVYGLAVTLIEAVTGTVPLSAPTPLATMVLRQDKDLPVPPELGPLRSALELAGKAKVDERCTAEEFAAALRSAAASLPRPKKLPLPGLERDPRAGGARTARVSPPAFEDETGILVLKDNDASIDLSSGADDVRVVEDVSPKPVAPSPRSQPVGPVAEFEPLDDELEDSRRRWPILLLLLVLGAGAFVAYNGRDGQVAAEPEGVAAAAPRVENYVGLTYDEAVEAVERNGWVAIPADGRADGTTPGDVIEQSPGVGADLAEGMEITIVISEGQILRIAPEVVGLARADALAELADAGLFMGDTGEEFHETAPVGEIVFASVPAGTSVETGTAVDLIWSLGPAPREIPGLAGSLLVDAQLALDELGLTYVVVENYSQTVPEGEIISTDPAVGVVLDRGAEVTLVVSLGLPFIEVPNVSGMVAAEAADVLTAAGFVVVDTVGPPNGEVLATDPPAGELIRQGSSIVIFVRGSGG